MNGSRYLYATYAMDIHKDQDLIIGRVRVFPGEAALRKEEG